MPVAAIRSCAQVRESGDEGGFAPDISQPEDVLALLVAAITESGYEPGRNGIGLAMDPASSEFYRDGAYQVAGEALSSDAMIERYAEMIERFPIWLLEDGLAESDWEGWERLTARLGERLVLVGDDILCTNPAIISEAIARKVGNAALIKVNQIGTVTETLDAMRICRDAGWAQLVSHRSGETDDSFIADLATGTGCGQIKTSAPARGERVTKYNRLIEIAADARLSYRTRRRGRRRASGGLPLPVCCARLDVGDEARRECGRDPLMASTEYDGGGASCPFLICASSFWTVTPMSGVTGADCRVPR